MNIRIGILHAHHSNIAYFDRERSLEAFELTHYVDPGLIVRMNADAGFGKSEARRKAAEQLEWIAASGVDAIVITCTQYIAVWEESRLQLPIPVICLDEPFFERICSIPGPQIIVFSNPATVEGTMDRLRRFAFNRQRLTDDLQAVVAPESFHLIMQGKEREYTDKIAGFIRAVRSAHPDARLSVAQLSMVQAAELIGKETGIDVGHPLQPLIQELTSRFLTT